MTTPASYASLAGAEVPIIVTEVVTKEVHLLPNPKDIDANSVIAFNRGIPRVMYDAWKRVFDRRLMGELVPYPDWVSPRLHDMLVAKELIFLPFTNYVDFAPDIARASRFARSMMTDAEVEVMNAEDDSEEEESDAESEAEDEGINAELFRGFTD